MSLSELAARVEAAMGSDRELDAQIWIAVTPGATRRELRGIHKASGKEQVIDETREPDGRLIVVPAFTASLDAAMTLVPDGWFWMAGHRDNNRCRAYVNNGQSHFVGIAARPNPAKQWFECLADTPALALCAAALIARAASGIETEGHDGETRHGAKHESPAPKGDAQ